MSASGSLVEPPCQPGAKIVEVIQKANCNIKMNSIMIPPPPKLRFNLPFRAWVNALILPITLYLFAVSFTFLTNAFLLGTYKHAFGHAGYTLLTAVGLAGFLYVFRKDRRDLAVTLILYLLLNVPGAMMYWDADSNVRDVFDLPRSLTKNNCCAISLAVSIMFFTASSCFFQNRFVQRLIRLVSAVLWGAAVSLPLAFIAYWLSHDGLMNADTLIAIWQTNPSEAVEYFSYKGAMFTVGVCLFAVLLSAISIRALTCRQSIGIFSRAVPVISVIMLATSIAAAMKNAGNLTTNIVTAAVEKVQELNSFESKLEERKSLIASLEGIREQGRHGLYVVIVGESQTRDRMSAYGYEKETTPWLTRQAVDDHFVLMQNAYSCYPNTVRSLEQALTARSQFTDRPLAESPSIVEIARAAGYHVSWLSNQNRLGGWDSPTTVIANEADHQVWINETIGEKNQSRHYDDALLDELRKIPVNHDAKQLVFLHVLGCHSNYEQRYPSSYASRDGEPSEDYDNAVRFSDDFTRQVYEYLRTRSDFQALLFFSDHGEDPKHGHTLDPFTWKMVRIPLWAAFSDGFIQSAPEAAQALKENVGKFFTNDMVFDLVCGLLDIQDQPYYEPHNDPASPSYSRTLRDLSTISGKYRIADDPNLGQ